TDTDGKCSREWPKTSRNTLRGDIAVETAKPILFENDGANRIAIHWLRFGDVEADKSADLLAKLLSINPFGEIGTNRSEDVSAMKGITYRLQIVVLRGDVAHMQPLLTRVDQ